MSSRRNSIAPSLNSSQKYTSDRHLRQADHVLKLEGDNSGRTPGSLPEDLIWIDNPPPTTVVEDIEALNGRTDVTNPRYRRRESVFRIHPGRRLLSIASIPEDSEKYAFAESNPRPWDEPKFYQDSGGGIGPIPGRRTNVIRQGTFPIEVDPTKNNNKSQFRAPQLNRSWRINTGSRHLHQSKPSSSSGLLYQPKLCEGLAPAAELAVAFTVGLISQRVAESVKRKHLHVFDYKIGKLTGRFISLPQCLMI